MDTNLDTKNDKTPDNTEVLMIFVGPPELEPIFGTVPDSILKYSFSDI